MYHIQMKAQILVDYIWRDRAVWDAIATEFPDNVIFV